MALLESSMRQIGVTVPMLKKKGKDEEPEDKGVDPIVAVKQKEKERQEKKRDE